MGSENVILKNFDKKSKNTTGTKILARNITRTFTVRD